MSLAAVKILLVEDSPSDAALLQESLLQCDSGGFEFTLAESWGEAAARLRKQCFDVLLLDLSLPDTTGRNTFIRARAEAPQLPIVVLIGQADETVGLEAVRHGIQDYLIKGQSFGRQTMRAIRYDIERKQAENALPNSHGPPSPGGPKWPSASAPRSPIARCPAAWRRRRSPSGATSRAS